MYPGALAALARCASLGTTVILSDGDAVLQPLKVRAAGLWEAVGGRVLIYVHKEQMLEDVARHYPAAHYVLVDDKVRILAAVKQAWGDEADERVSAPGSLCVRCGGTGAPRRPDLTLPKHRGAGELRRSARFLARPARRRYAKLDREG